MSAYTPSSKRRKISSTSHVPTLSSSLATVSPSPPEATLLQPLSTPQSFGSLAQATLSQLLSTPLSSESPAHDPSASQLLPTRSDTPSPSASLSSWLPAVIPHNRKITPHIAAPQDASSPTTTAAPSLPSPSTISAGRGRSFSNLHERAGHAVSNAATEVAQKANALKTEMEDAIAVLGRLRVGSSTLSGDVMEVDNEDNVTEMYDSDKGRVEREGDMRPPPVNWRDFEEPTLSRREVQRREEWASGKAEIEKRYIKPTGYTHPIGCCCGRPWRTGKWKSSYCRMRKWIDDVKVQEGWEESVIGKERQLMDL